MNINELDTYDLADAVKFNDELNPRLWKKNQLRPPVRRALLKIADDFREFLGLDDLSIHDITMSGSNAAFTYTPHSDIDLHLVVNFPESADDDVYRELFDAKKYQYNDQHNISIGGYDVELYVEDARTPPRSAGIYSIKNDDWVKIPLRHRAQINDASVKNKFEDIGHRIEAAIKSGDYRRLTAMARKVKNMRQAGLEKHGEFGAENLAYKILRTQGLIKRLYDARNAARDRQLSLAERERTRSRVRYGFGESTKSKADDLSTMKHFIAWASKELGIQDPPRIILHRDPTWPKKNSTFGRYVPEEHTLHVAIANRHIMDNLRTLAHELSHCRQHEIENMPITAGDTGSDWENEAHATAGILMRRYGHAHPDRFVDNLDENGDEAGEGEKWPGEPLPFPKGTVKVGVSDVYDWYKLGQDISDLDDAEPHDYGKGPPEAVLSFGSEDLEHKYIQQLKRLGMDTKDIDETIHTPIANTRDADQYYQFVKAKAQMGRPITRAEKEFLMRYEMVRRMQRQVAEGKLSKSLAAAAVAAAMSMAQAQGQEQPEQPQPSVRDVLTTAMKLYGISRITQAGAQEELTQELKNYLRAQQGDPGGRNQSRIWQWQQRQQPQPKVDEGASGYIPTKKQARDPRFKTALTVDIRPGEVGRQANKLALDTDSQGRPALLIKDLKNALREFKETGRISERCWTGYRQQGMKKKGSKQVPNCVPVNEEEDLLEVKMSPGELRRWAESPEAEGIKAGFEAEMIFRDTSGGDSEDYEPDYDQDERARDIDEVVDFFRGGDEGISGGMANRLRENLWEEYIEWRETQIYNQFEEVADEQVRDYMETNVWSDDTEQDRYRERAAEELGIETSEQSAEQAEEIEARARELFDEEVEDQIDNGGRYYDDAREYYRDMMVDGDEFDQSDWFRNNYSHMSSVADAFELDWPYWTGGREGTGSRSVEDIAGSLQYAIDMPVVASSNYHATSRRPGRWIIEPDGSLDPDEPDDELGLEIVSPPMPLPETLRKLQQVVDWANGDGDAYTNSSTGLHMGMSIPFKGGDVDYIKLILFMGDQYVLDRFDRAANTYCASALEKLRQTQTARRRGVREQEVQGWDTAPSKMTGAEKTAAAMDLMRKNLIELAQRLVQDGVGQSKYTSAHIKDDYIEFRSPGGDYLSLDSREDQALEDTMLRFARAMYIAGRPDVERREYSKKLYKLLSGFKGAETAKDTKRDTRYRTRIETEDQNDAMDLFARYSAGMINAEELKKQWAEQVLAKEAPPQRSRDDAREYEVIRRDTGEVIDTIKDWSLKSANETALVKYSGKGFDWDVREKTDAEPEKKLSRRAQVAKRIKERPSIWRVTDTNTNRSITVAADDTQDAKYQARNQDENFKTLFYNDPDSMLVEPASAEEAKQYQVQQADKAKDSEQVQQRVQGSQDGRFSMYRVRWTERRNGQEVEDSLRVSAANADAAMAAIRHALEAQGREITSINAVVADSTEDRAQQRAAGSAQQREYQIYLRSTNQPVVAFMAASDEYALARLEQYRQQHPSLDVGVRTGGVTSATRNQLPQGEFTGNWQVRNASTGEVVHTFGGVGNNQGDANRVAQRWAQQARYDDPIEVVPEMG